MLALGESSCDGASDQGAGTRPSRGLRYALVETGSFRRHCNSGDTAGEDRHGEIETTGKSYVEHNANHIPTAGRAALARRGHGIRTHNPFRGT
jgi:hypothetical protein